MVLRYTNLVHRALLMNCLIWYIILFYFYFIYYYNTHTHTCSRLRFANKMRWTGIVVDRKKLITNASLKNWCDSLSEMWMMIMMLTMMNQMNFDLIRYIKQKQQKMFDEEYNIEATSTIITTTVLIRGNVILINLGCWFLNVCVFDWSDRWCYSRVDNYL